MTRSLAPVVASLSAAAALVIAALVPLSSCSFDGFCLNCAENGEIDAGDGDGDGDAGVNDAGDMADACIPSGVEQCDGLDNDCNGEIDDGALPGVGVVCSTDVGVCVEGVTECVGGDIICGGGAVEAVPETCDGLDNDCDGTPDNGDPGGGQSCGTDVGECVAGVTACSGGIVDCIGDVGMAPEVCDGRDNDCDANFDEGTGGGQCGITDTGLCSFGMEMCIGGTLQCQGAVNPAPEVCDNMDHDCDGDNLNGFDLDNDVLNCGTCGHNCYADMAPMGDNTAVRQCVMGSCEIGLCATDFHDLNNDYADGCEYGPCEFQGDQEACNGSDDDCDAMIDEDLGTPPAICQVLGECAGTTAECDGSNGYVCNYGPTVSTDMTGAIIPENTCDGLDNDCDGRVDEAFPTLGDPCDDGEQGICRGTGFMVCNAAGDNVECQILDPGQTAGTETCDNTDEDCDGTVDEGDHQEWVDIGGGVEMFKYEASRPDADDTTAGLTNTVACSKPNALPWTNITHPQAEAECAAIGGRLCSEAEWEGTCQVGPPGTVCEWSYENNCDTYQPNTCNGNDFDTDPDPGDQDRAIPTGMLTQCFADIDTGVFDMSGNIKEWTAERAPDVNPIRGGSFNNTQVGISCDHDFLVADDSFFFPNIGFRCCRD